MKFKRIRLIPPDQKYNAASISPLPLPGKISPVLLHFDREDNLIGIEVPSHVEPYVEGQDHQQPVIKADGNPKEHSKLFPPFQQLLNKLDL